jgi:hypothetical protein
LVPFGQVVSEEKIKPEALKSLYRSPGNKKKQFHSRWLLFLKVMIISL